MSRQELVALSRWAGQRFDLIQAGGGNTSYKLNDHQMLVKASGCLLADVSETAGFALVDHAGLVRNFGNAQLEQIENKVERQSALEAITGPHIAKGSAHPSIETLLHSLMGPFVLHTHPIVINALSGSSQGRRIMEEAFPEALVLPYETPGADLGLVLDRVLKERKVSPDQEPVIVFLMNHGLIVSALTSEEVVAITDDVVRRFEKILGLDFDHYHAAPQLAQLVGGSSQDLLCTLSHDRLISQILVENPTLFERHPTCPDTYVYCGYRPVRVGSLDNSEGTAGYEAAHQEKPKVLIYKERVYFVGTSFRKLRDQEEVFRFHLLANHIAPSPNEELSESELLFLGGWDAEKYRQQLQ